MPRQTGSPTHHYAAEAAFAIGDVKQLTDDAGQSLDDGIDLLELGNRVGHPARFDGSCELDSRKYVYSFRCLT